MSTYSIAGQIREIKVSNKGDVTIRFIPSVEYTAKHLADSMKRLAMLRPGDGEGRAHLFLYEKDLVLKCDSATNYLAVIQKSGCQRANEWTFELEPMDKRPGGDAELLTTVRDANGNLDERLQDKYKLKSISCKI